MIAEIRSAYEDAVWMLEDLLRKTPDEKWRAGQDDYLIPARVVYHVIMSFEWLTSRLPREEHLKARRYNQSWLGPVETMPAREDVLADLDWVRGLLDGWFADWVLCDPAGEESQKRRQRAVYYLRHIQHHIGELSVIARLLGYESPEWK